MSGEMDNTANDYIRRMFEKSELSDLERTLIAGNIRGFYAWLKDRFLVMEVPASPHNTIACRAFVQWVFETIKPGEKLPSLELTFYAGWRACLSYIQNFGLPEQK